MNLNKVILIGRISQQPTSYQSRSGAMVVRFNVAVTRDTYNNQEEITDFLPVVAFGNNATFINKYFNRGDLVNIVGSIEVNNYTNKQGENTFSFSIVVEKIKSLEPLSITQQRAEKNKLSNNGIGINSQSQNIDTFSYQTSNSNNVEDINNPTFKEEIEEDLDNPWELDI